MQARGNKSHFLEGGLWAGFFLRSVPPRGGWVGGSGRPPPPGGTPGHFGSGRRAKKFFGGPFSGPKKLLTPIFRVPRDPPPWGGGTPTPPGWVPVEPPRVLKRSLVVGQLISCRQGLARKSMGGGRRSGPTNSSLHPSPAPLASDVRTVAEVHCVPTIFWFIYRSQVFFFGVRGGNLALNVQRED